jgi:phosphoglycerate dehydrogenase-like enzyme
MMKALLHFTASTRLREQLARIAQPQIVVVAEDDDASFQREIRDADVLLHVLKPVTAAMIAQAPKLKLIQKIGVGVNTIDREAARNAGVAVANMPGTNTPAVAEHTLMLMLAALRRVVLFDPAMRAGQGWRLPPDVMEAVGEINGSTIGLIGFGAVPQRLAPVLTVLGAHVQFWSHTPRSSPLAAAVPLNELLTTSDIVSLHVPLADNTRRLLDHEAIAKLKRGVVVVNTARGELIDTVALAAALGEGHVAGAGLDVFEDEPNPDLELLSAQPTVVMSPHVAWLTPQTFDRSLLIIIENCRRVQNGISPLHRIDG